MRRYGISDKRPDGVPERTERCVAEVFSLYRNYAGAQCSRYRGMGPDGLYCRQHATMIEKGIMVWTPEDK